jgi:FdhE protein
MNSAPASHLQNLRSDHPEWDPWLAVVDRALEEANNSRWESFVPTVSRRQTQAPVLAETAIALPIGLLEDWTKRLFRSAAAGGTAEMATLRAAAKSAAEAVQLFRAALCQDIEKLRQIAQDSGANARAFQGVAELLPIPFLQACGRHLAPREQFWMEGYCPTCGAWPVFAEIRGIERARYLRCGRCGDEWQIHWLQCPFCGESDHQQLLSLVPQKGDARAIEACNRCEGYIKSFTTLQGADRLAVLVNDLASIDLDIAAVEQGYNRPPGPGYSLNVTVGYSESGFRRIFPRGR